MQVFKLCMKIIKKNLPSMMIYVVVFLSISIMITLLSANQQPTGFTQQKTGIAVISEENSPLIDGFKQELSKSAYFVNIPDEKEKIQDALFFREVSYIIRIPKGFTQAFMNGENVQIEKMSVPASGESAYLDISINHYFKSASLYVKNIKGISQQELVQYLKNDMAADTPVHMGKTATKQDKGFFEIYFNYLSYALSAVLILGVSSIMLVFNNKELSRRNFCSPLSSRRINFQFILANLIFTISCWVLMMLAGLVLGIRSWSGNLPYYLLNSFIFTLSASSISFLIGNLLTNRNAVSAVCNVVALGPSFISGVFVPQELLGSSVLKIASFTPTYWYVKANADISELANFSAGSLSPIYSCLLVELGFAVAFFALSLVVGKRKRMSD
ncbi:MAG TPA: ABC transporter permease [Caproiciproducens sp.]|nr:ABC transporter permease [Caproiciproducens sp.]